MTEGTAAGRPRGAMDMIAAATASVYGLTVVTANERHLRDMEVDWFNSSRGGS